MARHSVVTIVSFGTTAAQALPAREGRVGLLFTPHLTQNYALRPDTNPATNIGLNVLPCAGNLELSMEKHGDIVKHAWYILGAAASMTVGVLETFEV